MEEEEKVARDSYLNTLRAWAEAAKKLNRFQAFKDAVFTMLESDPDFQLSEYIRDSAADIEIDPFQEDEA